MAQDDDTLEVEVEGAGMRAKARGKRLGDIVMGACLVCMAGMVAVVWYGFERFNATLMQINQGQLEIACILTVPTEQRTEQFSNPNSLCRYLARSRSQ